MKSQDILIMFKLISLRKQAAAPSVPPASEQFSVRALAAALGLSKSEVSNSVNRCKDIGLIQASQADGLPVVNASALLDFCTYAIRYVFPAKPGPVARGMPTAFAAPVMQGVIVSAGELVPVWPWAQGMAKGQAITPLFKSVPQAAAQDALLYGYLALLDAIRTGGPREARTAQAMLREQIS